MAYFIYNSELSRKIPNKIWSFSLIVTRYAFQLPALSHDLDGMMAIFEIKSNHKHTHHSLRRMCVTRCENNCMRSWKSWKFIIFCKSQKCAEFKFPYIIKGAMQCNEIPAMKKNRYAVAESGYEKDVEMATSNGDRKCVCVSVRKFIKDKNNSHACRHTQYRLYIHNLHIVCDSLNRLGCCAKKSFNHVFYMRYYCCWFMYKYHVRNVCTRTFSPLTACCCCRSLSHSFNANTQTYCRQTQQLR